MCLLSVSKWLFFAQQNTFKVLNLKINSNVNWKQIYIYKRWFRNGTSPEVSWALFLKLQAAGINFEKLLGWIVFKNPNFNPFQSSSVLAIRGICCFCYVYIYFNLRLKFSAVIFMFLLI